MANSSGKEELMTNEVYNAAVQGNMKVFSGTYDSNEYLLKTYEKNNILHVAIRHQKVSFALKVLGRFPELMSEANSDGNNPLHIAAEFGNEDFMVQLLQLLTDENPLRMQNSDGNTPIHVAIIYGNFEKYLFGELKKKNITCLTRITNKADETPFHLLVTHDAPADEDNIKTFEESEKQRYKCGSSPKGWKSAIRLLEDLLKEDNYVAYMRDKSGLTPLHRVASVNSEINIVVIIKTIHMHCPSSVEVCDSFGRNILHHLINKISSKRVGKDLFEIPEIKVLANHQDNQGDTPLHMAVIKKDVVMAELLLSVANAKFNIKNKKGLTAANLIQQTNFFKTMEKRIMTKEESLKSKAQDYPFLETRLKRVGKELLLSRDSEERNHLHNLLMPNSTTLDQHHLSLNFIQRMLEIYPELVYQTDIHGDTPVHILARYDPHIKLFDIDSGPAQQQNYDTGSQIFANNTIKLINLIDNASNKANDNSAWLIPNVNGNTPLHEAVVAEFDPVLSKLVELGEKAAKLFNKHNETVIHLLAKRNPFPSIDEAVMDDIIRNTEAAHDILDENGLSPLMRAFDAGNFEFAKRLCSKCPKAAETLDVNGRTFWHLLVSLPQKSFDYRNSPFTEDKPRNLLKIKDNDGMTALHLAIEKGRFDLAELFLGLHGTPTSQGTTFYQEHLLKIPNDKGITPSDLIGEKHYVPSEFVEFVWKVSTMVGIRSMWGIPSTQIKDYMNAMGVIAALLTTITFTAAFAVPGGPNQKNGTPLLINVASFQAFMISDILAMCLSMMVLFCLLWIMATGNKSKSVVLLDFCIILLLASFYTTLVTFMTGLYATTHLVKPGVAIFGLVLCSMLLLLMHHYLVMKLIIPSGKVVLILVYKVFDYASKMRRIFIHHIKLCCCQRSSLLPISSV